MLHLISLNAEQIDSAVVHGVSLFLYALVWVRGGDSGVKLETYHHVIVAGICYYVGLECDGALAGEVREGPLWGCCLPFSLCCLVLLLNKVREVGRKLM
jgi:hypothetical protein